MTVVGALVVGALPLIVDRVRRGDVGVGVALGRLRGQDLACGYLARCQRTLNRHTVKLNRAGLDNENSTRLLVTKTAVSTCPDILTGVGRIGCKGIGGRAIDLRRARRRRVAAVPRPRNVLVGGHITRSRISGRRDGLACVGLARLVELNARDVDGTRSTDRARALSIVIAAADLCGYMATDRLALVGCKLKGARRCALDIGVGAALSICDLPLIAQLRGINVIGSALLFSECLDSVVNGIDEGAGGGAFGGQDGGVDVHSAGLLEGTHAVAGRPAAERDLIRARVRGNRYVVALEVVGHRERRAGLSLDGLPRGRAAGFRGALVLLPGVGDLRVIDVGGAVAQACVRLSRKGRADLRG